MRTVLNLRTLSEAEKQLGPTQYLDFSKTATGNLTSSINVYLLELESFFFPFKIIIKKLYRIVNVL